ncbi:MAG TPA: peptide chain release factor N(5)-glutamine methyltransferase [Candidatus Binatia bacterium]|nr:peptide chain release factor N(5)-glutamine methyltransferase [Candidatus Binatia bacterium]
MTDSSIIVGNWIKQACNRLEQAGIGTARLDALVLLEDSLGKDRSWLLAHPELPLTKRQVSELDRSIERRAGHEPLAYIRGKTEFYGREFYIDKRVLEPRPESEAIIDELKKLEIEDKPIIIDIGTGSGALAITAKLELPSANVTATDIDPGCLAVALKNIETYTVACQLLKGDLLEPVSIKGSDCSVLLCNLPYVPNDFQLNSAAMNEPRLAIFGGKDGLDLYRKLFKQLDALPLKAGFIITESLPTQHKELARVATSAGFDLVSTSDFVQVFRLVA